MKLNRLLSFGTACILTAACLPVCSQTAAATSSISVVTEPNGITIKKYADHAAVTACSRNVVDVTIPQTYEMLPVTEIEKYAFEGCTNLQSVNLPESITSIQYLAFSSCLNLKTVIGGKNVTFVGSNAFYHTPWLKEQMKDDKLAVLGSVMIDGSTFSKADAILPDNVDMIAAGVFFANRNVKRITVPKNVNIVAGTAFDNIPNLEAIAFLNPNCQIDFENQMGTVSNGQGAYTGDYFYDGTIIGYEHSTAYVLAMNDKFKFRQFGDCDGNDISDARDAILVLQLYANRMLDADYPIDSTLQFVADVDHNTVINQQDAIILLRYSTYRLLGETMALYDLVEKK